MHKELEIEQVVETLEEITRWEKTSMQTLKEQTIKHLSIV